MVKINRKYRKNGLLPRMQARPFKNGSKTAYRYITHDNKSIFLGHDLNSALRKVIEMNEGVNRVEGKISWLWDTYQSSAEFKDLSEFTQSDYRQCSKNLLRVFGDMQASGMRASMIYRYLKTERATARVRGNREITLLSNLIDLAIRLDKAESNPCRQARRNREQPRKNNIDACELSAFLAWLKSQNIRRQAVAQMAQFCALVGSRKIEFLRLKWENVNFEKREIKITRAKQKGRNVGAVFDLIAMNGQLESLMTEIRKSHDNELWVFPTRLGSPYTNSGFKGYFGKIKKEAEKANTPFPGTFHDLRSFYATTHKSQNQGKLPDLHANPQTTANIYDNTRTFKRKAIKIEK